MNTIRVRNRRTGQWIELPADDGLCSRPSKTANLFLCSPEDNSRYSRSYMNRRGDFDSLPPKVRWAVNIVGHEYYSGRKPESVMTLTNPATPGEFLLGARTLEELDL